MACAEPFKELNEPKDPPDMPLVRNTLFVVGLPVVVVAAMGTEGLVLCCCCCCGCW